MWQSDFRYFASLTTPNGEALGNVRLNVDWVPAVRWAEFERGLKRGRAAECESGRGRALPVIEPAWSRTRGRPYLGNVTVRTNGSEHVVFPLAYFVRAVSAAAARLVAAGSLAEGQRFDFDVYALADAKRVSAPSEARAVAIDTALDVDAVALAPLLTRAVSHRAGVRDAGAATDTMPIFIPERVLMEATERAERSRDIETGAVLVGKLCRDRDGTLFSRVTAQIPAEHTEATRESLRFTPDTWTAVGAALRLRNRGEIVLGWSHSHPWFCERCTPAQRAVCPLSAPTFSNADRHVHREVFQQPWNFALLISFLGHERPSYDMFAWNRGQIEAAPFYALPETDDDGGDSV
jgi:proteasome lid subunit RPN8/RPN11